MPSLRFVTLAFGALVLSTTTLAQEDDPTTVWITPTVTLPSPYDLPSIYATDGTGSCEQATLALYSSKNCRLQTTVYPSTTTLAFPIDCLGCSQLTTSVRAGQCPMGGHHSSYPDTTMTAPRTRWSFVCAPTPAPAGPISAA
ncbi:hypothetical protein GE09DRAFT_1146992 [Coniochaeta sp. 2T2.1]|nr:hypothetical protein GE09DRAFT_1146992 [Coniochaeta sp. 2T2.1]